MLITTAFLSLGYFGLSVLPAVAPTVLAAAAIGGVAATGVLSAQAGRQDAIDEIALGPNEERGHKIKRKIRTYAKPAITGLATAGAVFLSDRWHMKYRIALAGAAKLIQKNYDGFKTSAKQVYGEDAEKKIVEHRDLAAGETVWDYCKKNGIEPIDTHSGSDLWFEPISQTWFVASDLHVTNAAYNTNRNFKLRGNEPFNEWLGFLDLPDDNPQFDLIGWNEYEGEAFYGYRWIDVTWEEKTMRDGTKYKLLRYPFEPHKDEG